MRPDAMLIAAAALLVACTPAPTGSRIPLSICQMARYVDYLGQFEVRAVSGTEGLKSTTLRLIKPIIVVPPNEGTEVVPEAVQAARLPEVIKMRSTKIGDDVRAQLELPPVVTVGAAVTAFLGYSTVFKVWADVNGQGVFFQNPEGRFENQAVYDSANAVTEAELMSEIERGSRLSRTGSPHCDEGRFIVAPVDAGLRTDDGGR